MIKKLKKQLKVKDDLLIGVHTGLWAGDGSRFHKKGYTSKIHFHKAFSFLFDIESPFPQNSLLESIN